VTREQLRWQKEGARKALEHTMLPLAHLVGHIRFADMLRAAVDALFEADEAFYCPPAPPSGTEVVLASGKAK
jgi:hypothetical protein